MKKILFSLLTLMMLVCSCGPMRHVVYVEMRYPSKSGIELAGKNVSVVYLENGNSISSTFSGGLADGFAYSLEQDYGTGEGSIGIYSMKTVSGSEYSSRDTLINLLMETGSDVVFLIDTLAVGELQIGGPTSVASASNADSSYVSTGSLPFTMKMYCYDAMNKEDRVLSFSGSSVAVPYAYSNGRQNALTIKKRAKDSLPLLGFEAGRTVSSSFKSQWRNEQYSILYFDSTEWYKAVSCAEDYAWHDAMDIWLKLLDSKDILKRSCAAYNLSVASYMLGDYELAEQWLERSDADNKLPLSEVMHKRIDSRKK